MSDLGTYLSNGERAFEAKQRAPAHVAPKGWEPGIDTERGVLVGQFDAEPDDDAWAGLIRELGLDPADWVICSDRVNVRSWDANMGRDPETGEVTVRRLFYYKADVRPRRRKDAADIEALAKRLSRFRRNQMGKAASQALADLDPHTFVVCLADWQAGGTEGIDGSEALVARVEHLMGAVVARVKELRKAGRRIDAILIVGMGDLVEGCDGWYPMQPFLIDLNRRDQKKLVRRLLQDLIVAWAPLVETIIVAAVPGNHGENRKEGKAYTDFADNDDVAVFEEVMDAFKLREDAFPGVVFHIPDSEWDITLEVPGGSVLTFIHGHQLQGVRGGGSAVQDKAVQWWKNFKFNDRLAGQSTILVSAHFHHWDSKSAGTKTWFQCPALDNGSEWFEKKGGDSSVAGTLTFLTRDGGWSDLSILRS